MGSTVRAAGISVSEVRYALQVAIGAVLALALAFAMLMAAGPASAESIPQNPLIEDILKLNDIKLVRRDDRLGIGNLVVKHPKRVKAKPEEPNYESWGTAFLVGECYIMTARHVVDPDDPDIETILLKKPCVPRDKRIDHVDCWAGNTHDHGIGRMNGNRTNE